MLKYARYTIGDIGVGEVIDFKSRQNSGIVQDRETRKLMEKVHDLQDALGEIYDHIESAYENLNTMESECNRVEVYYDETILALAQKIGPENVPVEFLNYSTNIVVEAKETGEVQIKWEAPNKEFEIIFTPDEE